MNGLQHVALIGTGKQSLPAIDQSNPAESLDLNGVEAEITTESQLLFRLGRVAVYNMAGQRPISLPGIPPAPAAAEMRWSERFELLLKDVIHSDRKSLLPEFLQVLKQYDLPLPKRILPDLLTITDEQLRRSIQPVLGDHGKWLSQFNADWNWATSTTAPDQETVEQLEVLWDEGTTRQRSDALREVRKRDPHLGRRWLQACFSREKATDRQLLLSQLEVGLSSADEEFLDSALTDRSKFVRGVAGQLLAQLPDSALAKRNWNRALSLVQRDAASPRQLKLQSHPPDKLPADWIADGIATESAGKSGKRAAWTEELLANVALSRWTEHFESTPVELVNAILANDFSHAIITGWTRAFARLEPDKREGQPWFEALWKYWAAMIQHPQQIVRDQSAEMLRKISAVVPAEDVERSLSRLMISMPDPTSLPITSLLTAISPPWSTSFGKEYLRVTRNLVGSRGDQAVLQWLESLTSAAVALPVECFELASASWQVRESGFHSWQTAAIERLLMQFSEVIQIRSRFYREVQRQQEACGAERSSSMLAEDSGGQ